MNNFRLIIDQPADGAWNMAVDEAILEDVMNKEARPTLRLYAWQPECLSLGYSQSIQDVDLQKLQESGWGIVRRLTGGRAILHADELTYSVIAPTDEPLVAGSLLESYNRIAGGLLAALDLLGLPVEINNHSPGLNTNSAGPVCFEMPSAYEITLKGKKLIGSAQARRKHGVLQHGSFPLYGDLGRIVKVLNFSDDFQREKAKERLMNRATNVEIVTGKKLDWDEVAKVFVEAFSKKLGLHLEENGLTSKELDRAVELVESKYARQEWNGRV